MITTLAALMRTIPIVLGVGATRTERRSLGPAVVGGLPTHCNYLLFIHHTDNLPIFRNS
ncbi:AcrB/AcrD/AcrF family protein [Rickettsia endosymbiont of Proechinophthirus fluctus]|uniref:AcrB/AcrD/AcrF family protein n=1 Tax=Rickettsia endosymbiont of Proechinophthirus fluctus TaxID=1462733 RepID=UPI000AE9D03C|nr:AcrB/AcrD/AcrF family protein [Rickettsia endosymbiont of Proechinophthirus fluctus]